MIPVSAGDPGRVPQALQLVRPCPGQTKATGIVADGCDTVVYRPGPETIRPNARPGGVVIHVWEVDTDRLLVVQHIGVSDDVEGLAETAALVTDSITAPGAAVVLVAYDGDTGERIHDWSHP